MRLLVLVATASAYPYQYYNPYVVPLGPAVAVPGPLLYPQEAPLGRSDELLTPFPVEEEPTARYLINFEAFQRVTGAFIADTTPTPDWTVTGTVAWYQNPFTGNTSKYKIVLNGLAANDAYWVGIATACDGTGQVVS